MRKKGPNGQNGQFASTEHRKKRERHDKPRKITDEDLREFSRCATKRGLVRLESWFRIGPLRRD